MKEFYSVKVYKENFNFACAHFMIFEDGTREPLHGHNYKIKVQGTSQKLNDDMVMNFLDIKPIIREICNSFDHKLIIPKENKNLKIFEQQKNYLFVTPDESEFSIPKTDCLLLPIKNSSVERIAQFFASKLQSEIQLKFNFIFDNLEIELEETTGQSATFKIENK